MNEQIEALLKKMEQHFQSDAPFYGLSTGFKDLDAITAGLVGGNLVVIGARAGVGKTTFALNLLHNISERNNSNVLFMAMQEPAEQILIRLIANIGSIEMQVLRSGQLQDSDFDKLKEAIAKICELKTKVTNCFEMHLEQVVSQILEEKKENPLLKAIVLDGIESIKLFDLPDTRRWEETFEICRRLKNLALKEDLVIIITCQLNRSLEQRTDRHPIFSDLPGGRALESFTDLVLFLYRDDYYYADSADKGTIELIVAKQRMGVNATIKLLSLPHYSKIEDYVSSAKGKDDLAYGDRFG